LDNYSIKFTNNGFNLRTNFKLLIAKGINLELY
jgi:hypothetical protein